MQSRLSRTTEKKTKHQLVIYLIGIVVLLFILFKFGIPALTNLSLFLSSKNTAPSDTSPNSPAIIAPPVLSQPFSATNSATILVNGQTTAHATVQLFVNSSLVDTQAAGSDGSFHFTGVALSQQQNQIQAKAKIGNTLSDFSDAWNVN